MLRAGTRATAELLVHIRAGGPNYNYNADANCSSRRDGDINTARCTGLQRLVSHRHAYFTHDLKHFLQVV